MKEAMIVVSFGTSVPSARSAIDVVEHVLKKTSNRDFFRAFTSPTIRRILTKRGEKIKSLEEILDYVLNMGYEDVVVQPTHLLYGVEYDKIRETVDAFSDKFKKMRLGKPLLADEKDLVDLAACVLENYMPEKGAMALMGHGTTHFANMTYPAFQTALNLLGAKNVFVGTVEVAEFDDVLKQLKNCGEKEVLLVPLMLVAGDHAKNDMAGDNSWKTELETNGFQVECHMEGLGALKAVQDMYCERLKMLLEEDNGF